MAKKTNCPECGRTNVKGKGGLTGSFSVMGACIGSLAGGGVFSLPTAAIGAAVGATVGKVISSVKKQEYRFKCPRCGCEWYEDI